MDKLLERQIITIFSVLVKVNIDNNNNRPNKRVSSLQYMTSVQESITFNLHTTYEHLYHLRCLGSKRRLQSHVLIFYIFRDPFVFPQVRNLIILYSIVVYKSRSRVNI